MNLGSHFMSCVDLLSRLLQHVLLVQPYNLGLNEAKKAHHFPRKRLSACVCASDHFNRKKEESKENHVTKYAAKQRKGHCVGHELGQESQLPSSWEWERTTGPHFPLPQLRLRFHRKCRCSKVGAGNEVPWCVDLDAVCVRRKTHFFNIVITIWE